MQPQQLIDFKLIRMSRTQTCILICIVFYNYYKLLLPLGGMIFHLNNLFSFVQVFALIISAQVQVSF